MLIILFDFFNVQQVTVIMWWVIIGFAIGVVMETRRKGIRATSVFVLLFIITATYEKLRLDRIERTKTIENRDAIIYLQRVRRRSGSPKLKYLLREQICIEELSAMRVLRRYSKGCYARVVEIVENFCRLNARLSNGHHMIMDSKLEFMEELLNEFRERIDEFRLQVPHYPNEALDDAFAAAKRLERELSRITKRVHAAEKK